MQRKFALLILGALVALVVPASAIGAMFPAEHKFEILPSGAEPAIGTSLGNCRVTKISGQIPKAPANEGAFEIPAPTIGNCTSGTTITVKGTWKVVTSVWSFNLFATGPEAVTLRFASLPGCKLEAANTILAAVWSNGTTTPTVLRSGYHPHSARGFTWANDGGSCALSGKKELVSYYGTDPEVAMVNMTQDITNPSMVLTTR